MAVCDSLWNYNPSNEDVKGDDWNGENFSWFSDHRARLKASVSPSYAQTDTSLDIGGRLLHSIVKPYAAKVAGVLLKSSYEVHTGWFKASWAIKSAAAASYSASGSLIDWPPLASLTDLRSRETEIFIPNLITRGRVLSVEGVAGTNWRLDESRQTLFVLNPLGEEVDVVSITVTLDPPLMPRWALRDHSPVLYALLSILVVVVAAIYVRIAGV